MASHLVAWSTDRSFLCMWVLRTLSWYIAKFSFISWLVADTGDKHECISCSLEVAWLPFACMQYFILASHVSDAIHHLKDLICNLEQITSYGWLVLTTIFRWLILTVFDSNDCKQILPGGERVIHRCSLEEFFFFFWLLLGTLFCNVETAGKWFIDLESIAHSF